MSNFLLLARTRVSILQKQLMADSLYPEFSPLDELSAGYLACDDLLSFISSGLLEFSFGNEGDRLRFYKDNLSAAISLKVFCRERYLFQVNAPASTREARREYEMRELVQLDNFENRFGFFKGYFRSGLTGLDGLYFLPASSMEIVLLPEVRLPAELELGCCTYLLSRFKADVLLRQLLVSSIEGLDGQEVGAGRKVLPKPLAPTLVNLSVDQLGMGARAMLDAAVISGKSFQQVCEDLAPRISTVERKIVSAASIRSNAYTGEDVDKNVLLGLLEKMIRLIKGY